MARLARYQYIAGRGKPHKISYWREDGSRTAKFFASQGDALVFQAKINEENKDSLPDNLDASVDDRIVLAQIKSECKRLNADLTDALSCIKASLADFLNSNKIAGCDWDSAANLYLTECARRGARPSTLRGYKFQILKAKSDLNIDNVGLLNTDVANKYLSSVKYPLHAKRALLPFFKFCKAKGWVSCNPFDEAQTPRILREKTHPSIITPDDCRKLLNAVPVGPAPRRSCISRTRARHKNRQY